jgi:hypothetical protein
MLIIIIYVYIVYDGSDQRKDGAAEDHCRAAEKQC